MRESLLKELFIAITFLTLTVATLAKLSVAASPWPKILLVKDAHWFKGELVGVAEEIHKYYVRIFNGLKDEYGIEYENCTIPCTEQPCSVNGPCYNSTYPSGCKSGCKEGEDIYLQDYDVVIWVTGEDSAGETLVEGDQESLKEFLDNGGMLFLTGQDIGYDIGTTSFYQDYLHAYYCKNDIDDWDLEGRENDPIGHYLNPYISGGDGADNQDSPSVIYYYLPLLDAVDSSRSSFYYGDTSDKIILDCFKWVKWLGIYYVCQEGECRCGENLICNWTDKDDPCHSFCDRYEGDPCVYCDATEEVVLTSKIPSSVRVNTGGPLGYKVVYFAFGFEAINNTDDRKRVMGRVLAYLFPPRVKESHMYVNASSISGEDWVEGNLTCDPSDEYCHRGYPKINATCRNYQLFGKVSGAEYYIDDPVLPERFAGNGINLQAKDGSFNDDSTEVVEGVIIFPENLQLPNTIGTHYLYVHCNDTDGYWGKYDKLVFTIDRYHPLNVIFTSDNSHYTNKTLPNFFVEYADTDEFYHYSRFSCNGTSWTPWEKITGSNQAGTFTFSSAFNVTVSEFGCPTDDGNRTIYVQIRDSAGNWHESESTASFWVFLDRKAPRIISVSPQNKSHPYPHLKSSDNITVTFYDPSPASGVESSYWANESQGVKHELFNNTPFNPGWKNEGTNYLYTWIIDKAGNVNKSVFTFVVDDTPPYVSIIFPEDGEHYNTTSLNLNFTAYDVLSGVDSCWYSLDGGDNQTIPSCQNITMTNLTEGVHELKLFVNDSLATRGNENSTSIEFTIDLTKPFVYLLSPTNGSWLATQYPEFSFKVVDNLAKVMKCKLYVDGSLRKEFPSVHNNTTTSWEIDVALDEGLHNWTVACVDKAGNSNVSETRWFYVDVSTPEVKLISPVDNEWVNTTRPKFYFNATDNLSPTLTCKLYIGSSPDNSTEVQSGEITYILANNSVGEGRHEYWVECFDMANNGYGASSVFRVDVTPPRISDLKPSNETWTSNDTIIFEFNATDNLSPSIYCSLLVNSSIKKTLETPGNVVEKVELIFSSDGVFSWKVNCSDEAGNENETLARLLFVDFTPPSTSDNASSSWTKENQTILLTCVDNLSGCNKTLYCTYDEGATPCEPSQQPQNVSKKGEREVNYTLEVDCPEGSTCKKYLRYFSNDTLSNEENVKETLILIDKQAPSITILSPQEGKTYSGVVELKAKVVDIGVGVDKVWFEIRNSTNIPQVFASGMMERCDDDTWCSSWDSSSITNGTFVFNVSANDTFGYLKQNVNVTFHIANTYPSVKIYYPSRVFVNDSFNLNLTVESPATPDVNISFAYYNISNETRHMVKHNESGIVNQSSYVFSELFNISSSCNNAACSEGNYTIFFWANNTQGKISNVTSWFVIDITRPSIRLNSPADDTWFSLRVIDVSFTPIDNLSPTLFCELLVNDVVNASDEVDNSTQIIFSTSELEEGHHSWKIRCKDKAGNSNVSETRWFYVDVSKPKIELISPGDGEWLNDTTLTLKFKAIDNLSPNLTCDIFVDGSKDGSKSVSNAEEAAYEVSISEGEHSWKVNCSDLAKNSNESYPREFYVDVTPPEVTLISPDNDTWTNNPYPTFEFKGYDNLASRLNCSLVIDGIILASKIVYNGSEESITPSTALGSGERKWKIVCKDFAGNTKESEERVINVDTLAPNTSDNVSSEWKNVDQSILLTCKDLPSDNPSGCNVTLVSTCDAYTSECSPFSQPQNVSKKGEAEVNYSLTLTCDEGKVCEYYLKYYSNDTLGNLENVKSSGRVKIDKFVPRVSILSPKDNEFVSGILQIKVKIVENGSGIKEVRFLIKNSTFNVSGELSESDEGIWVSTFDTTSLKDGTYELWINASDNATNVNCTEHVSFKVDNTPPSLISNVTSLSLDKSYGDYRLLYGEQFTFSAELEDFVGVDSAFLRIKLSNGENWLGYPLSLAEGNENFGNWSTTVSIQEESFPLGAHTIHSLVVADKLGNTKVYQVDIPFRVVNLTLELKVCNTTYIDAGRKCKLNLTIDFNKTVPNPSIALEIPKELQNQTAYACSLDDSKACNVENVELEGSYAVYLEARGLEDSSRMNLTSLLKAVTPLEDRKLTWNFTFMGKTYKLHTLLRTPYLNITNVTCDSSSACEVEQKKKFNFTVFVENVNQPSLHTGSAYEVFANYTSEISAGIAKKVSELLESGEEAFATWELNLTKAGEHIFKVFAWEFTRVYNATFEKKVKVLDVEKPQLIDVYWKDDDNVFNRNETIEYFVKARDNVGIRSVWVEVNNSEKNFLRNLSLALEYAFEDYELWKLEYKNDSAGIYNITRIFVNDTSGNLEVFVPTGKEALFEIRKLSVNASVASPSLKVGNYQNITASISGNASLVTKVVAKITKPYGETETITLTDSGNFTYVGSLFVDESGNYSINVSVTLASGIERFNLTNFSSPYGTPRIETRNLTLLNGSSYEFSYYLYPQGGDLIGVNASLIIDNESVIISEEGSSKTLGDILWKEWKDEGFRSTWKLLAKNVGETNVTLLVNSSKGGNSQRTFFVRVVGSDEKPPSLKEYSHEYPRLNLMEENPIKVIAYDNETEIKNVTILVTFPSGVTKSYEATEYEPFSYVLLFNETEEVGNYTYEVKVFDLAGNVNVSSEKGSFEVVDTFLVSVTHSPYNKGDLITFKVNVTDARGLPVKGFNLTLVLQKNETGNQTLANNTITEEVSYRVMPTDPPESSREKSLASTYVVYATVTKNGNKGVYKGEFEVSEELKTTIIYPSAGAYFSPGGKIPLKVEVKNVRGEIVDDAVVVAYCPDCSWNYRLVPWNSSLQAYYSPEAFIAPNKESFSIFVYSVDHWKNMGMYGEVLTTVKPPEYPTIPPGGGGAEEGFPGITCNCTPWIEIGCGMGTCKDDEMYMVRTCNPPGCAAETKCEKVPACIKGKFSLEFPDAAEVMQGKDSVLIGSVRNNEKIGIKVVFSWVEKPKVPISLTLPGAISLGAGESKDFEVRIHVPLNVSVGEYPASFSAKSKNYTFAKTFKIIVKPNPLIEKYVSLQESLKEFKKTLEAYRKVGVDVREIEDLVKTLEKRLEKARASLKKDELKVFEAEIKSAEKVVNAVKLKIFQLKLWKFLLENKWNFIIIALAALFSNYFATQVAIPYYKLTKKLRKLKDEEQSLIAARVEVQKQYFTRKIDERTFFALMAEKQGKILRVRADVRRLELARRKLLISKLHPKEMLKWMKESFANLPKSLRKLRGVPSKKRKVERKPPSLMVPEIKISMEVKYRIWKIKHKLKKLFRSVFKT